jgi:ribosomal protein L12E/L44/L45/RPP1/RPP2
MAGESVVGALRVVLGLDTASFEDGTKKATDSMKSFGKSITEIASGIGLERIFESVVHSLKNLAVGGLETADALGKMAQKIGVPIEELSALKLAASLSDVQMETLARGIKNLAVEMNKAASGGVDEASAAFKALGLNITQASKPGDTLLDVADKVSHLEEGMSKTAIVAAIFGKRFGPDLIPLLDLGRKGIADLTDQARQMGLIITKETADAAQEFNDRMKIVGAVTQAVSLRFTAELAPAMADISKKLVDWVNNSKIAEKAANALVTSIALLADNLKIISRLLDVFIAKLVIQTVLNFAGAVITTAVAMARFVATASLANVVSLVTVARFATLAAVVLFFSGQLPTFTEAMGKLGDAIAKIAPASTVDNIKATLEELGFDLKSLSGDLSGVKKNAEGIPVVDIKKKIVFDPEAAQKLKAFNAELLKLGLQTREVSGEFNNLAPGFLQAAQSLKLFDETGKGLQATLGLTTKQAQQLNIALFDLKAAQLTQDNLLPWDSFQQKMEKLNAVFLTSKLSVQTFNMEAQKAAVDLVSAYGAAAQNIVGPMASAFKTLAEMNQKYAGIAKALAIAEAIVNTFVAATKALISPFGPAVGLAQAAVVTAAGLANVAKISATKFATGGSFKVGGSGGVDSQLLQIMATPGEMVDVRKPGQASPPASEVTVNLRGRDLINRDMMRDIFDAINEGTRDGYRLKLGEA